MMCKCTQDWTYTSKHTSPIKFVTGNVYSCDTSGDSYKLTIVANRQVRYLYLTRESFLDKFKII